MFGLKPQVQLIGLVALFLAPLCIAVPTSTNLRIQVNSESLNGAPYLLDAIRQIHTQSADAPATQPSQHTSQPAQSMAAPQVDTLKAADDSVAAGVQLSPVSEGTIEEILNLKPESILKLSPETIVNSVSPHDFSLISEGSLGVAESQPEPKFSSPDELSTGVGGGGANRAPQLPVTSSHLKRPAQVESEIEPPAAVQKPSGAKMHPPPVREEDESSEQASAKAAVRKPIQAPPDVWDPSQIMPSAQNTSMVPATVVRTYGHQTRTKITLGGGYTREQQPVALDSMTESSRELQTPPKDRPKPQAEPSFVEGEGDTLTRVIEVPEKIYIQNRPMDESQPLRRNLTARPVVAGANRQLDSRCPKLGHTTIEHPAACDKYYICENGVSSEHTCPNGLLYGTRDLVRDNCIHRWQAVCGEKTLPNPISSPGCRWQNGIFPVQGSPKCSPDYYECVDGKFQVKKCLTEGQVYDDRTKSCKFAELVGCGEEALKDFRCPLDDQENTYWPFPRYFLNERSLIHCINDKPQIVRCRDDERVDIEHLHCVLRKKTS